jgi:hypothetical protein
MLCNRRKSLNPILTLEIGSFPIVMAITVAILLLMYLTIPTADHPIRISDTGGGRCGSITPKTTALDFEHTGDEDKPIDPLVIAASQPGNEEIHCAVPRTLLGGSHWDVLVVKEEEFARATKLLNRNVSTHKPDPHADFQYVLVSKSGIVRMSPFSDGEAIKLFVDLAQYFEKRQPRLQEKLTVLIRRLGGPEQPSL